MKRIPLPGGKVALVDDEDYQPLSCLRWSASRVTRNRNFYAVSFLRRPDGSRIRVMMHRLILGVIGRANPVDHINHNGLDNRRENLRACNFSGNARNSRKIRSSATSQFKGVHFNKTARRWTAQIKLNGRSTHIGQFATEEEAARAYDQAAIQHFREFACINFGGGAASLA